MNDPASWALLLLLLGLLIRGSAQGLLGWRGVDWPTRGRVPSRLSFVLILGGLALGSVRVPLAVRSGATHPPPQRMAFVVLGGGENRGRSLMRRLEAVGVDTGHARLLTAEDACTEFPNLPLFCIPAEAIASTVETLLRTTALEIGAQEVISACSGNDLVPILVSDQLDPLHDVVLVDSSEHRVALFGRQMTLRATGDGNQRKLFLRQDSGEAISIEITPGSESSGLYSLGRANIRFRILPHVDTQGVLHVGFVDLRLECA